MTITITVQELQDHESSLKKWATEYAQALGGNIRDIRSGGYDQYKFMAETPTEALMLKNDKWLKENPMPRLVPPILRQPEGKQS